MSLPIIQTIQNNINSLKSTKTDIKNAVNTDYDFINNEQIESYPDLIKQGIAYYKNRVPHATKEGTDLSFNSVPLKFENMTIKGDTSQATRILPEGYTQLDYIESTGTQYIDTGINADSNLRTLSDMVYTNPSASNQNIGAINLTGGTVRYHLLTQSGKFRFYTNNLGIDTINIDTNRHVFDMDVPNRKIIVDGIEYQKPGDDFDVGLNFYIFGRNSTSTVYLTNMKLYRCQMWYNNILVRDFIPCKDSNNVAGLYDLVSQSFFDNDGTGDFVAGNEAAIPNPDYPQDIRIVTGENTINIGGTNYPVNLTSKNLFNINTITSNTYLDRYGNTGSSNVSNLSNYIEVNPDTSYKLSFNYETLKNSSTRGYCYYDKNKSYISGNTYTPSNKDATITTPSSAKYIRFSYDQNCFDIQLEEGSTATDYQGYYDIELCKIGDYQDYIYKEDGNWYKYNAIEKIILDGTWSNTSINTSSTNTTRMYLDSIQSHNAYSINNVPQYSDKLICASINSVDKEAIYAGSNGTTVIRLNKERAGTTKETFNQYLSKNNITVYYAVQESFNTQITDSTLISQLEALDKAKGNNGTTIITSTGTDLAPILNFTAYLKEVE